MAVLLVSMYAGTGLNSDVRKGTTGRFRALPVWRAAPVAGALLGDVARYLLAAGLVAVPRRWSWATARPAARPACWPDRACCCYSRSACPGHGPRPGWSLRTPQAVMSTGTVVLFPLTLASNVFVRRRPCPAGCRPSSDSTRSATW